MVLGAKGPVTCIANSGNAVHMASHVHIIVLLGRVSHCKMYKDTGTHQIGLGFVVKFMVRIRVRAWSGVTLLTLCPGVIIRGTDKYT